MMTPDALCLFAGCRITHRTTKPIHLLS